MIQIRKSGDRGHFDFGWLDTHHSFSFGDYYDPEFQGFSVLRVINEDIVAAGHGFPTHPHRDMEIITYILDGALEHKDSLGTGSVIRPGDVQRMSAGTGIRHSEANPLKDQATKLLQIWIFPSEKNLPPSYEQTAFSREDRSGKLKLVGSPDGRDGSVTIHQDVDLYASLLKAGDKVHLDLKPGRFAWLQLASGKVSVNGQALSAGDGAGIIKETALAITAAEDAELLLFDLPPLS
ncbi:MAG: pirin family protein [Rhodospirillaceae bacterium]